MELIVFTDGGSRGNPGISGYGLAIFDDQNHLLYQESRFIGVKTNNEAEYSGLIAALTWISLNKNNFPLTKIIINSDSQLLVRQIQGLYKVKASHLKTYHQTVINMLHQIALPFEFKDIPRTSNQLADRLANEAMDRRQP